MKTKPPIKKVGQRDKTLNDAASKLEQSKKGKEIEKSYLAHLFEKAHEGIMFCNNSGKIIKVNGGFTKLFGYTQKQAQGRFIDDLVVPEDFPNETQKIIKRPAVWKTLVLEGLRRRKDGTPIHVSILTSPVIVHRKKLGICAIYRGISGHKRDDEALQREKAYLEQLVGTAAEGILILDENGLIIRANDEFLRMFGFGKKGIIGKQIDDLIVPDNLREEGKQLTSTAVGGLRFEKETVRKRKDGSLLHVSMIGSPIVIEGQCVGAYAIYRDISDKKKAEHALRDSEKRYRNFFDNVPVGIFQTTPDGRYLDANIAHLQILGFPSLKALKKINAAHFYANPEERERWMEVMDRENVMRAKEFHFRRSDGKMIWTRESARTVRDDAGVVLYYEGIIEDISALKEAEQAFQTEKAHLEQLFESAQEGIVLCDNYGKIIKVNNEFTQVFGYTKKESQGRLIDDLVAPMDLLSEVTEVTKRVTEGKTMASEGRRRRKDGSLINVSILASPIVIDNQQAGVYAIYRDITKQKQAEARVEERTAELAKVNQELKEATEKAEKARSAAEAASQAKGMFLSRMSHEIRTPMNSVIGFSDMLLDTPMSEEQVEFVRNITKSGEALLSLINEILDFSKIEAGQLSFQNIDFDLEITAFDVCHLTQPRLGNKPVEILCRVGDNLPGFIKSDPTRMRQVLLNLMSNAIKFTHEGEIELFLDVEEENERQLKLHTTVRDTGIGIPADKLETVFEVFQQVDGSITRKYGGTGLGLAICKQIARLMNGEMWVESELGKGSTFHFTAWVDKSEKVFVKKPPAEVLAGKKALLVDDNENNLNILAHALSLAGMRTQAARSGGEVLPALQKAIAAKDPFDICLLDIQMPDMSGYEVSKQIREQADEKVAKLLLLAFSSPATQRIKIFKEAGFDGFLPKPIQRHTLITMLKRLLGEAGEEIEIEATREKEVVITQHTLAEEAKHSVRILLAEDNPMNQKLAQYMLTKAGYQLEVANNGRETV
ncbi:MAG: PAS domain S-box protein, partial [Candidatus Aminicenantes bacterium]|nr:PAS domain S-box protein [Candidatus Aminicenantes bacterium]